MVWGERQAQGERAAKEVCRAGGLQKRGCARLARAGGRGRGGGGGKSGQKGRGEGEVGKCQLDKAWRHLVATHTHSAEQGKALREIHASSCLRFKLHPLPKGKSNIHATMGKHLHRALQTEIWI